VTVSFISHQLTESPLLLLAETLLNVRPCVRQHLHECGPCLREFGLEEVVKKLVHKHCGHDLVPSDLRARVLVRIQQVRTELEVTEFHGE
jgi:mycothiol system anti-sigma-R factor